MRQILGWQAVLGLTLYLTLGFSNIALAQSNDLAYQEGKALFLKAVPACAICHTLNDAGSEGAVGPVLDEIKPSPQRITKALVNGLGSMPAYVGKLSVTQIEALARYVSKASGGAP
jgi:sulfite dehydrogenase